MHRWLASVAAGLVLAAAPDLPAAAHAGLIRVNGPIGPATAGFIARALDAAADAGAQCLVIELDTGGEKMAPFVSAAVPTVAVAEGYLVVEPRFLDEVGQDRTEGDVSR